MTSVLVELPSGDVEVRTVADLARGRDGSPRGTIVLAHGAGAGMDHPFLAGVADTFAGAGFDVVRFAFPYAQRGRRMPGPAAHAVAAWGAVFADVVRRRPDVPVIAAGRSYGGRMASMAAAEGVIAPAALVYLGYPLHPPGAPEKVRADHLPAIAAPQLFVSGTVDPFLQPLEQFTAVVGGLPRASILWVEGARHSFEVRGTKRESAVIGADIARQVDPWLAEALGV
ncbi:alpha/beta family hydrolase [Microbacterium sp.]|uniref:alpha/beta hydrolase family protein n=1 Tax=Microbacterium sp. TaxID=51671 RepID=UPI0039E61D85